ncbi:hypothetical protein HCN44_001934 [Aphidius gifuensis]|uniref:Phospholipid/glycerol acyltransferase domain-containing protein n=1 Tax=Aphidius gifuensis TaxID=684658 RepID=A0A835CUD1_APHGI|nr:hypothetical protein HCN44_001934 [Aphidius gifuensis]
MGLFEVIKRSSLVTMFLEVVFLGDWWSGSELSIYMNEDDYKKYYGKEHGFVLMNHCYEVDWIIACMLLDRMKILGNFKLSAKNTLEYFPVLGWLLKFGESIYLKRNWDIDKRIIGPKILQLTSYLDPMWLLFFAEGTRVLPKYLLESQKFSKEKGLPILKYHLTPRTKGFIEIIRYLRGKNVAIYDIQIAFNPDDQVEPTIINILRGKKLHAHCYIKRIPLSEVPDEEAAAVWLYKKFQEKDKMADSFNNTGDFFATSGIEKTLIYKLDKRYLSLINVVTWALLIIVSMLIFFIKLYLFGSVICLLIAASCLVIPYVAMNIAISLS